MLSLRSNMSPYSFLYQGPKIENKATLILLHRFILLHHSAKEGRESQGLSIYFDIHTDYEILCLKCTRKVYNLSHTRNTCRR